MSRKMDRFRAARDEIQRMNRQASAEPVPYEQRFSRSYHWFMRNLNATLIEAGKRKLTSTERLVWLTINDHAQDATSRINRTRLVGWWRMSIGTIAEESGVGINQVRDAITRLVDLNLLETINSNGGRGSGHYYRTTETVPEELRAAFEAVLTRKTEEDEDEEPSRMSEGNEVEETDAVEYVPSPISEGKSDNPDGSVRVTAENPNGSVRGNKDTPEGETPKGDTPPLTQPEIDDPPRYGAPVVENDHTESPARLRARSRLLAMYDGEVGAEETVESTIQSLADSKPHERNGTLAAIDREFRAEMRTRREEDRRLSASTFMRLDAETKAYCTAQGVEPKTEPTKPGPVGEAWPVVEAPTTRAKAYDPEEPMVWPEVERPSTTAMPLDQHRQSTWP